jgi:predicted nucleic acid-binding protein
VIVVDASVLANVVGDDGPDGKRARQEFRAAGDVAAPDLVDVETVAVLRKRWLRKSISAVRFAAAIGDLEDLAIDRYPTLRFMRRAYELRHSVTAYDATYIALAEAVGCQLLTSDQRVSRARGLQCPIRLLL